MTDDLEYRIGKLSLAPGDVLVVQGSQNWTGAQTDEARAGIRRAGLDPAKVLFVGPGVELSILTRAELEAKVAA